MEIELLIRKAMLNSGIKNQKALSKALGVSESYITKWKNGNSITDEYLSKLSKLAGISEENLPISTSPLHVEHIQIEKLSVKASCGGGNNLEAIDCFDVMDTLSLDIKLFKTPQKDLKAIEVEGYSMIPTLLPGSIVIFKEDARFGGDGLYVLNYQNTLMVKIVQLNPKGCFDIVSSNQDYKSYEVCKDDQNVFAIVGKVIKVIM